jgi:hypothetical protein
MSTGFSPRCFNSRPIGYGAMPPLNLKADEIEAITDYMSNTFKK